MSGEIHCLCFKHRRRRKWPLILAVFILIALALSASSVEAFEQFPESAQEASADRAPVRRGDDAQAVVDRHADENEFTEFGQADFDDELEDEDHGDAGNNYDLDEQDKGPAYQSNDDAADPNLDNGVQESLHLSRDSTGRAMVTVTDFGAIPDGTTLSTDSFNAAVRYLKAKGGGVLVVPPGKYLVTTIYLDSNIVFRMEKEAMILASDKEGDWKVVSYRCASVCLGFARYSFA
jgi:hypothetical protein